MYVYVYGVNIAVKVRVRVNLRVYVILFCRSIPGISRIPHQAVPHYTRIPSNFSTVRRHCSPP